MTSFRQPIEGRVYLADGHPMLIEFDSAATVAEVSGLLFFNITRSAASIRFEIWGGRESVPRNFQFEPKKISDFSDKFLISRQKFLTTFF